MKAKKVHITLTNENLFNADNYAKDNNMKFRSTAVNDLIQKGLEYNNITKLVEEIKILQIKLLGYAKTLEYFDKVYTYEELIDRVNRTLFEPIERENCVQILKLLEEKKQNVGILKPGGFFSNLGLPINPIKKK